MGLLALWVPFEVTYAVLAWYAIGMPDFFDLFIIFIPVLAGVLGLWFSVSEFKRRTESTLWYYVGMVCAFLPYLLYKIHSYLAAHGVILR